MNPFDKVISKYEKGTVVHKARMLEKSYKIAKLYVQKDTPPIPKVDEPSQGVEQ